MINVLIVVLRAVVAVSNAVIAILELNENSEIQCLYYVNTLYCWLRGDWYQKPMDRHSWATSVLNSPVNPSAKCGFCSSSAS
ncbi:hypothetical protein S475_23290 [Salmonella enterica subsp. enterica serovar Anatum]|nr:hypothetical protein [Salmonella enterica subsp. enterica serovar Anatum]EDW8321457.1 hypothetical protein [Salmonella enterica subsp. enterica serovar Anatum]MZA86195.1 hypothetical protein [Salmonella enterica subsp. enterica serovar Typhimurium]